MSAGQAKVISAVLDQVPSTVPLAEFEQAETQLVNAARTLPPKQVGDVGTRILAYLDPDGVLASDAEHQRRREFTLTALSDGSYRAHGYLTPTCGAQLLAVLDAHAAPSPAEDGTRDPRTRGQRMHDALETLSGFAVRRGELLHGDGAVQLVITMTADQLVTGHGLAETSFGQLISIPDALHLADEAKIAVIIHDTTGAILAEGRSKRCATRAQTLALIARDKGCSFPGCDRPPDWCQRHHIIAWINHGLTDVDNLTLLCAHHHRNFAKQGWQCHMNNGLPWWTPPPWIDPNQQPQLNQRIHHA